MFSDLVYSILRKRAFMMLTLVSIFLNSMSAFADINLTQAEKVWLQEHPVIQIGIDGDYAPYSFQTQPSTYQGIAPDFIAQISQITGLKFEIVPNLTWPEILVGGKNKTLDVIATATKSAEREEFFNFSQIYINTPLVIMKQRGNSRIRHASDLIGKKVALVAGYSSTRQVLTDYPDINPKMVKTPLEGLQAVAIGEVDAYIGVLGVSTYVAREYGLTNLIVSDRYNRQGNGQRFAVRKDWPELASILDKALDQIPLRKKNEIVNNWIPVLDGEILTSNRTPVFTLSRKEKDWLQQNRSIDVGVMNSWPPMDYVDDKGNPKGIGTDFVHLINKRLNGALNLKPGEWSTNLKEFDAGNLDAILDITPTDARRQKFAFTTPYVTVPHVIFGKKDAPYIEALEDLNGKKVALEKGFFLEKVLRKSHPEIQIVILPTTSDALDAVSKNYADAYIGNRAVAMYIIRSELIENLVEHGKIKGTSSVNAIAVRKESTILLGILQKALDSISVGEQKAITKDWIEDPQRYLLLTPQERRWLKSHPVISVAADIAFPPIEFVGSDGEFQGLAMEYLDEISSLLGIKFKKDTTSSWARNVDKLKNGQLDMFTAAAQTAERKKYALFTSPYMQLPLVIFTLNTVPYIDGISGLKGKRVAVVKGYAVVDNLKAGNLGLNLIEVNSIEEGLQKINDKTVDAYIGSILVTSHTIREQGYFNIRVAGDTPFKNQIAMAVRQDLPIFHSILQKSLNTISDNKRREILGKWVGLQTPSKTDYTFFWQISIGGLTILILFFSWNAYLQRKIRQQTSESKNLQDQLRHAQKMDAVGQLTGGIAHDFNNILAIVLGNLELLQETSGLANASKRRIETAISGAQRGADLTRKLLNFSREDTGGRKTILVNEFIKGIEELIVKSLTVAVDIRFNLSDKLWLVEVDVGDLQDAIVNLAINARDAMPEGGTLVIETKNITLDDAYVDLNPQSKTGNYVMVSISDTGQGMALDIKERIFEPFFTTKEMGKGTGLGLSMVYGFVKRSGGHITINSQLGEGTTFQIYLPCAKKQKEKTKKEKKAKTDLPRGTEVILIVDDEIELANIASTYLEDLGYKTYIATSGQEVRKAIVEYKTINLLFSDVIIPGGVDGFELAKECLSHNSKLKILLTSGFSKKREESMASTVEINRHLAANLLKKPYTKSELAIAIRQNLDGTQLSDQI